MIIIKYRNYTRRQLYNQNKFFIFPMIRGINAMNPYGKWFTNFVMEMDEELPLLFFRPSISIQSGGGFFRKMNGIFLLPKSQMAKRMNCSNTVSRK